MAGGFLYPVDVANRGLQHVGSRRITLFTDNSKAANEINFSYDKLRKAELARTVWRFAVRSCALRPIGGPAFGAGSFQMTAPTWAIGTTYHNGNIVADANGTALWTSELDPNVGNTPGVSNANIWRVYTGPLTGAAWSASISYYPGELVSSGGVIYRSNIGNNLNSAPPSANWVALTGAVISTIYTYDTIGFDPAGATQRYVYQLPNGYLRTAPQDVKTAGVSVLNVSAGMPYSDFEYDGFRFTTTNPGPIIFRYVGDITDVTTMPPMFCEGLAARLGMELCEPLTQSAQKFQGVSQMYDRFIREARAVNAIEAGSTEIDELMFNSAGDARTPPGNGIGLPAPGQGQRGGEQ